MCRSQSPRPERLLRSVRKMLPAPGSSPENKTENRGPEENAESGISSGVRLRDRSPGAGETDAVDICVGLRQWESKRFHRLAL